MNCPITPGQNIIGAKATIKDNCIYFEKGKCRACEKFCESDAIDFDQQDEVVEIALVADNPGDWAFHCHVIEHQKTGLTGFIRVV